MNFRFGDDANKSARYRRRPPDYSSRGVKIRLATLIALLGFAILAMNEAGKTETWERLGFRADADSAAVETAKLPAESTDDGKRPVAYGFWKELFRQLSSDQRELLFQIIDERLQQQEFSGNVDAAMQLMSGIDNQFHEFVDSAAGEVAAGGTESTRLTIRDLTSWLGDKHAKLSGAATDMAFAALQSVQDDLDTCAYRLVEDRSLLGRSAESLAWTRSWQRLGTLGKSGAEPLDVDIVQLMGQPNAYRGKLVRIRGTARGLESVAGNSQHLSIDNYLVLWIQPREMSRTPYCVYLRSLPDGFPEPAPRFQRVDEPVQIEGVFFKLRSYIATDDQIETCPLIVAHSLKWQPQSKSADNDTPWQPPIWILTLFFVGMPVIAAWLALVVYRSTKAMPIQTGKTDQRTISDNLKAMADDESIKSDRQRVDELRRQLNDQTDLL